MLRQSAIVFERLGLKKTQKYCLLTGVKLCVCFWELDYTYRMTQYVLSVQRLMSVNLRLYSWFGWWLWQLKKKKIQHDVERNIINSGFIY